MVDASLVVGFVETFVLGIVGFLALLGVSLVAWGAWKLRGAYAVRSRSPVPVARALNQDGVLEVEGTAAELAKTTVAPYTDTECLAYWYAREKRGTEGYEVVESGHDSAPFVVADDSGEIPVDPVDGDLSLERTVVDRDTGERVREGRIEAGDDLHVRGQRLDATERDDLGTSRNYLGTGSDATARITDGDEGTAVRRLARLGAGLVVLGVFSLVIAALGYGQLP